MILYHSHTHIYIYISYRTIRTIWCWFGNLWESLLFLLRLGKEIKLQSRIERIVVTFRCYVNSILLLSLNEKPYFRAHPFNRINFQFYTRRANNINNEGKREFERTFFYVTVIQTRLYQLDSIKKGRRRIFGSSDQREIHKFHKRGYKSNERYVVEREYYSSHWHSSRNISNISWCGACNFCSSMYTCAYRVSGTSSSPHPPLRLQWSSPFKPAIPPSYSLPKAHPFPSIQRSPLRMYRFPCEMWNARTESMGG